MKPTEETPNPGVQESATQQIEQTEPVWAGQVETLAAEAARANEYDPDATRRAVFEAIREADEARLRIEWDAQAKADGIPVDAWERVFADLTDALGGIYNPIPDVSVTTLAPPRGISIPDFAKTIDDAVTGATGGARQNLDDWDIRQRFAAAHGKDFCYDGHRWYGWGGFRWQEDHADRITNVIGQFCKSLSWSERDNITQRKAENIASNATIQKTERLARCEPTMRRPSHQWDADPMLLGVPTGVVDLRTGHFRPASRTDLVSKSTAVIPCRGTTV